MIKLSNTIIFTLFLSFLSFSAFAQETVTVKRHESTAVTLPLPDRYCDTSHSAFGIIAKKQISTFYIELGIAPNLGIFWKCGTLFSSPATFGYVLVEDNNKEFHDQRNYNQYISNLLKQNHIMEEFYDQAKRIAKNDLGLKNVEFPDIKNQKSKIIWVDDTTLIQQQKLPSGQNYDVFFTASNTFSADANDHSAATYMRYFKHKDKYEIEDVVRNFMKIGKILKN